MHTNSRKSSTYILPANSHSLGSLSLQVRPPPSSSITVQTCCQRPYLWRWEESEGCFYMWWDRTRLMNTDGFHYLSVSLSGFEWDQRPALTSGVSVTETRVCVTVKRSQQSHIQLWSWMDDAFYVSEWVEHVLTIFFRQTLRLNVFDQCTKMRDASTEVNFRVIFNNCFSEHNTSLQGAFHTMYISFCKDMITGYGSRTIISYKTNDKHVSFSHSVWAQVQCSVCLKCQALQHYTINSFGNELCF